MNEETTSLYKSVRDGSGALNTLAKVGVAGIITAGVGSVLTLVGVIGFNQGRLYKSSRNGAPYRAVIFQDSDSKGNALEDISESFEGEKE